MTDPDDLIAQNGEPVTLTRVTDFDAGRDGVENVTREYETVQAWVHSPSESQAQRLEGRLQDGAISVTLPSDTDVEADRDGGRDRIIRPAADPTATGSSRIYTVEDVSDDTHPMVDITKLTVVCNELDREDLSDDADTYTEV